MLTLDVLYAVLQGLHPNYLTHLEPTWLVFCRDIHEALQQGNDPASALQFALDQAWGPHIVAINKLLREVQPAMQMPGLSRRQKEALIALRYSKVASLTQLSRTLLADASNTQKRLNVLIKRGFALKFSRQGGLYYFAIPAPLDKGVRLKVNQIIRETLNRIPLEVTNMPPKPTKTTKS
jgi:predicted transcriptional regulator